MVARGSRCRCRADAIQNRRRENDAKGLGPGGSPGPAVRRGDWTAQQKTLLIQLVAANGGKVNLDIARKVRKSIEKCAELYAMLCENAAIGKPVVVVENGVRITKCPPAYARGIWPTQRVGYSGTSSGRE